MTQKQNALMRLKKNKNMSYKIIRTKIKPKKYSRTKQVSQYTGCTVTFSSIVVHIFIPWGFLHTSFVKIQNGI